MVAPASSQYLHGISGETRQGNGTLGVGVFLQDFVVPAGLVLALCCWLGLHSRLAPSLRFQLNLGDMSTYSALPTNLVVRLSDPLSAGFLALTVPIVMVTLGVFESLRSTDKNRHYADVLLALGVTGFMLIQKHIVREMNGVMLPICVASLLAYLFLGQTRRTWGDYVSTSIVSGMFLFLILQSGTGVSMVRASVISPPHKGRVAHVQAGEAAVCCCKRRRVWARAFCFASR